MNNYHQDFYDYVQKVAKKTTHIDAPTAHAYLANRLQTKADWVFLVDAYDTRAPATLNALMPQHRDGVHVCCQPMGERLFMLVLVPKSDLPVARVVAALSEYGDLPRSERRRRAREIEKGRDIIALGCRPEDSVLVAGLLNMIGDAALPH